MLLFELQIVGCISWHKLQVDLNGTPDADNVADANDEDYWNQQSQLRGCITAFGGHAIAVGLSFVFVLCVDVVVEGEATTIAVGCVVVVERESR